MAITTFNGMVDSLVNRQQMRPTWKIGTVNAGAQYSTWMFPGNPGPGVAPSTLNGVIPTSATAGAIKFTNAGAGNNLHLFNADILFFKVGITWLYDRLWHNVINVTSTSLQTITQPALTRPDAVGKGVEAFWEAYATMGAAGPTLTVKYTNSAGATNKTGTLNTISGGLTGRLVPLSMASGDHGVAAIESVQLASSGLSGTAGMSLRKVIAVWVDTNSMVIPMQPIDGGLPRIYDDACLDIVEWTNGSTWEHYGHLVMAED